MNRYKWIEEFQQRKDGVYNTRFLEFRGKIFYYQEYKTHYNIVPPYPFDRILKSIYDSRFTINKFDTALHKYTPLADSMYRKSYFWRMTRKYENWVGATYQVPFEEEINE